MLNRLTRLVFATFLGVAITASAMAQEAGYSAEERQVLRDEIRAFLLENPEVLMEAIGILEQRQAQETANATSEALTTNQEAIFSDGYSFVGGNPEGSITMVEFLDYNCGFCKRAHTDVKELLASDGDIRLIVKEFPILGPTSVTAARAAKATLLNEGPEAYERLNDALMTFQGRLNDTSIERIADGLGIDVAAMKARMDSAEISEMLTKNRAVAQALQVNGTPTFIIGDEVIRGFLPLDELRSVVERERSKL